MGTTTTTRRRGPDEDSDTGLLRELAFLGDGVRLEPFTEAERKRGRTPDFRIWKGNEVAGLCELKSPRDDRLAEALDNAAPGEIVGVGGNDPIFNRLRRQLSSAAKQFAAIDPRSDLPHVLVIVNHDEMTRFTDLNVAINGYERFTDEVLPVQPGAAEGVRKAAAPWIDLIIYIDAKTQQLSLVQNRDRPKMAARARTLAGV